MACLVADKMRGFRPVPREEAKEVLDIIFTRRKFFEAQRFVFAALRILFLREKNRKSFAALGSGAGFFATMEGIR